MSSEQINVDIGGWSEGVREELVHALRRYVAAYPPPFERPPTVDERIAQAAVAERDRIRQLAIDHDAHYHDCGVPCRAEHSERPFADLLDGAP